MMIVFAETTGAHLRGLAPVATYPSRIRRSFKPHGKDTMQQSVDQLISFRT